MMNATGIEGLLDTHDALGLAQLIRSGQIHPGELLEAVIERTERMNPDCNFVSVRNYEQASQRANERRTTGLFEGVPLATKDLGATIEGVRSTNGCRLAPDMIAPADNEMISRLRKQGFNFYCSTTSAELGLSYVTETHLYGTTRNPWDLDRTPGGSSGGSAALVASGVLPVAHANDGGGSIRVPASCCGLFGLKPTRARAPAGPFGEGWSGLTCDNAVSRSVRDNAAFLDAIQGPEIGAPYWCPPAGDSFVSQVTKDPGRLRIGFMRRWPGHDIDSECVEAVEDAARLCEALGHEVVEAVPDFSIEQLVWAVYVIVAANTRAAVDAIGEMRGKPATPEELEMLTHVLVEKSRRESSTDYAAAIMTMHQISRQFACFMEQFDVHLSPTLGRAPLRIGALHFKQDVGFDRMRDQQFDFAQFTMHYNASGHPAASVPLYWSKDDLPIGVQIGGRFGAEATLLRLAGQLEAARPWFGRRPKIHASNNS
ncbi:amidase [Hyphomonas sp.]|uniref:amidase n=1 Tax=Hyphomonas sp. TaxID=87 RepID=UPI003527B23A